MLIQLAVDNINTACLGHNTLIILSTGPDNQYDQ